MENKFYIIKNDYGKKIETFKFDYHGDNTNMDFVILNSEVILYENGIYIESSMFKEHIYIMWDEVKKIKIDNLRETGVDILYSDGVIGLKKIKEETNIEKFKNIINEISDKIEIEYIKLKKSNVTSIKPKLIEKRYQEYEKRMEVFIEKTGLDNIYSDEFMGAWESKFINELKFPVKVIFLGETDEFESGTIGNIIGTCGINESFGVLAHVKFGRKKRIVPFSKLDVYNKNTNETILIDDYNIWFGGM
ncbi:MAG: hypothetical protein ABF289_15920 [Clostridiales bacterium]